jgi:hypothetical protein
MAVPTYHQGLAMHGYHHLYPEWFFLPSLPLEVTQLSDVVYRDVFLASAKFATISKQPLYQFVSSDDHLIGVDIEDNCLLSGSFLLPYS